MGAVEGTWQLPSVSTLGGQDANGKVLAHRAPKVLWERAADLRASWCSSRVQAALSHGPALTESHDNEAALG